MKQGFMAKGTTCKSCEQIIIKQAKKVVGVNSVTFDYSKEIGYVDYDKKKTDINTILSSIEEKGYDCYLLDESARKSNYGWIFIALGILIAGFFFYRLAGGIDLPEISQNMGYGLILIVGLLTGFHCIGMCGGFVVGYTTQCAKDGVKPYKAHAMYAIGKTLSYTLIGALFGLVGSIIAFTPALRGVVGAFAGIFLILYGLRMLNVIPVLRKINIPTPKFIWKFVGREKKKHSSPLVIGLLNGLMIACGPLQAIYIMAAGTGSMVEGAKILFIFGIGTLPVMITFGYFISIISHNFANKIVKVSAVIVIALGLVMINNGLVLTGSGYDLRSIITPSSMDIQDNTYSGTKLKESYQEIRMEVTRNGWEPDTFVLKKDVPVKWIIEGKELNGCNNAIQVPKYGLKFDIKPGTQIIEFTPTEEGQIRWSCWMGMIPGMFIVKEDIEANDDSQVQNELSDLPELVGGSCGVGGGCHCGGSKL